MKHIKKWLHWSKHSLDPPISKILVLFKIIKSPTFDALITPKEFEELMKDFWDSLDQ